MIYRSVATIAVVILLVGLGGCSGVLSGDDGEQAAEIRDRSIAAIEDVSSYSFALELETSAQGLSVAVESNGSVDLDAREMHVVFTTQGIQLNEYIVNDTLYQESYGLWDQRDAGDLGVWQDQRQLDHQRKILENGSVSLEGEDTIDGEPVYELRVEPEPEDVDGVLTPQQGESATGVNTTDDATYTFYLRQSDYLIERVDADITASSDGQEASADLTITFSEYNEDQHIELPPEAEDAPEAAGV